MFETDLSFDYRDALSCAASWRASGRRVALATVVETWGSAPRPAGSQLAIDQDGRMAGSVSGGCIEGDIVRHALEVMAGGPPRLLEYGVSDEQAWQVGLPCGGSIRVFLEPVE